MSLDLLKEWQVTATVFRGGRDARGNPITPTTHEVTGLFAPSGTDDPNDWSDATLDVGRFMAPVGADIITTDVLEIPGHGRWAVDGRPMPWPLGIEVPLRREGTTTP